MSKFISATHNPNVDNTLAAATIANAKNLILEAEMVSWSFNGTPTGAYLIIATGAVTLLTIYITSGGPGFLPLPGIVSTKGGDLSATLAAGGAVKGNVTLSARI